MPTLTLPSDSEHGPYGRLDHCCVVTQISSQLPRTPSTPPRSRVGSRIRLELLEHDRRANLNDQKLLSFFCPNLVPSCFLEILPLFTLATTSFRKHLNKLRMSLHICAVFRRRTLLALLQVLPITYHHTTSTTAVNA